MSWGQAKHARVAAGEAATSDFVPYSALVAPGVVKTIDGAYVASWKIEGIPFETSDEAELAIRHEGFNQVLRGLKGGLAVWAHRIRRPVRDRLQGGYAEGFASTVAQRYEASFGDARMMTNDSYLTLVYRPQAVFSAGVARMFARRHARTVRQILQEDREALKAMTELGEQLEAGLRRYEPTRLTCIERNGVVFSEQLAFYGYLLNGQMAPVGLQRASIRDYLPTARLLVHGEVLEIRGAPETLYAGVLDLKDYPGLVKPGVLNELLYAPFSYIETQSFSVLSRPEAKEALERQRNQMLATEDVAGTQIEALDEALDQLIDGQFNMGEYHYSLAVLGSSREATMRHLADARTRLNEAGFQAAAVDLVADAAWFAQLPANWRYRPREAKLTSRNFAALSAFHGFGSGKRDGNPWGEAVTILKTPNGAPYYFNWHGTPDDEDSTDKKAPANTTIIGMTGSGKTVLELFLVLMSLKYGPTVVFFDKDRGAEIAIRAMGGTYRCFKRGQPTGMNPFQLPQTETHARFLEQLVKTLVAPSLRRPLTPEEDRALSEAVRKVQGLERRLRRLSALLHMLPINTTDGGLHAHLKRWCQGGSLGWVLDNAEDRIDLSTGRLFGFDDTDFLEDAEILAPVTMYLLHCTESLIDGRRFMYVMAEFWKRLSHPAFADFAVNKQYTIRKQNGFGIFDTQSPAQILKTPHVAAMVEQSATQIFLPNPRADHNDYVKGFKLTEAEFQKIRSLGEASRQFLVKQGHRSTVVTLDLKGMDDVLDVLSGTTDNVDLLDEIRAEVGDEPERWLPVFRARLTARRDLAKKH